MCALEHGIGPGYFDKPVFPESWEGQLTCLYTRLGLSAELYQSVNQSQPAFRTDETLPKTDEHLPFMQVASLLHSESRPPY